MDQNNFTKINDEFVMKNEPIIRSSLNQFKKIDNYEDVLQEARIWSMEAKVSWNKKKSKWSTYLYNYVSWKYRNYAKKEKTKGRDPKKYGIQEIEFDDIKDAIHDSVFEIKIDERIFCNSILDMIENKKNRDIVKLHLMGFTYKAIGEKYDVSHTTINTIYLREINDLKEKMKEIK